MPERETYSVGEFIKKRVIKKLVLKGEDLKCVSRSTFLFRIFVVGFILVVSLYMSGWLFNRLVFSLGRSTPYYLFLKVDKEPEIFDYVIVKTPPSDPFTKGKLITKRISCCCGSYLRISGLDYYCCGKPGGWETCIYLGKAKTISKKGVPVKPFNPCGRVSQICEIKVPENEYFLVNNHPDSYDSRYLGFFSRDKIVYVVKPVF